MKAFVAAALALACTASPAVAQDFVHWSAPAAPASGPTAYFPMGTPLKLETRTELNTKYNRAGDRFYLTVAEPLVYRGQTVVPAGSIAVGEVMRAEHNGHFGKRGELEVRMLYVQTPSGPVTLSGRTGRNGTGQGMLSIGGALFVSWPMLFIHGTSGRLPADTALTAYLQDDLRFTVQPAAVAAVTPDTQVAAASPAPLEPAAFAAK